MVSQGDCPDEELVSTNGGLSAGALTHHVAQEQQPKEELLEGAQTPTKSSAEEDRESDDAAKPPECTMTVKRVSCPLTYENLVPHSISIGADSSQKS